jgi:hypothetical protein
LNSSEQLVVPASRLKLVGQFFGGVAFVAVGVFMILYPGRRGLIIQFWGVVSVAFFGSVAVAVLYRLLNPAAAIIINAEGIVDNSSGVSVGLIPWNQVGEIEEHRVKDQLFLGIAVKDLDALLARQPRWKRKMIRANLAMGTSAVNIPQASIGMKIPDLAREIRLRRR